MSLLTLRASRVFYMCIMCVSNVNHGSVHMHHGCITSASYVYHMCIIRKSRCITRESHMYHWCTTCAPHTHQPKPTGGSRSHPRLPVACMQRRSADTAAARRQREDSAGNSSPRDACDSTEAWTGRGETVRGVPA